MPNLVAAAAAAAALSMIVQQGAITVAAASSLGDAIGVLARAYERETGTRVRVTTAGSNTLARQIVEGAPIDVFISADEEQMDTVERAGRLEADTRIDLLSNRLVVIAAREHGRRFEPRDLAGPAFRRLALGNPGSVPAGVYAREWLSSRGLWEAVHGKVVPFPTVRAALGAVAEGRVDAGIVYATDARTSPRVRVLHEVPAPESPRIVYPAAAIRGGQAAAARAFTAWLRSATARAVFVEAGFMVVDGR